MVLSSSYSYFDELRRDPNLTPVYSNSSHVGRNLHTFIPDSDEAKPVLLCHVPMFLEYTNAASPNNDVAITRAYGIAAAAIMAMHHWNNGIGTIVDDIQGINVTCPIRFTTEIFDTESSAPKAIEELLEMTSRSPYNIETPQPCAILGTIYSSISVQFATVSSLYDLLQISPAASSINLENRDLYPLFTRTHPSDGGSGKMIVDYLHDILGVKRFVVVYVDDAYGNAFYEVIRKRAKEKKIHEQVFPVKLNTDNLSKESAKDALKGVSESQLNYFVGVFFSEFFDFVMEAAGELGIAGAGKFWIFNGGLAEILYYRTKTYPKDSILTKALDGNALLTDGGGVRGDPVYESFQEAWRKLGNEESTLNYINSKHPKTGSGIFNQSKDFFLQMPTHFSTYSYEAIIGMGISACQAFKSTNSTFQNESSIVFSGKQHHDTFLQLDFNSATGAVKIGNNTISRDSKSLYYTLVNFVGRDDNTESDTYTFEGIDHSYYDFRGDNWIPLTDRNFTYANGTINQPELLVETKNLNLVSVGTRSFVLTLGSAIIVTAIGFVVYSFIFREHRAIRIAQPPFLAMICIGSILMGTSIFTFSIDEGIVERTTILNNCCLMTHWLAPLGFIINFSALFSKLWRLNQIFDASIVLQQVKLTAKDVLVPFFVLLFLNVLILVVWTTVDPIFWKREPQEYNVYEEVISSIGYCSSDHRIIFLTLLIVINGISVVLACHQAYRARKIQTDMNDSKNMGMAMLCIFQSFFFGLPILVITSGNTSITIFVYTSMIFVICMTTLFFTFVPIILRKRSIDGGNHILGRTQWNSRLRMIRAEQRARNQVETLQLNSSVRRTSDSGERSSLTVRVIDPS